jgi:hypothetical protein
MIFRGKRMFDLAHRVLLLTGANGGTDFGG